MSGLEDFALHAGAGHSVGFGIPSLALGNEAVARWIVDRCSDLSADNQFTAMAAGIFAAQDEAARDELLNAVFEKADARGLPIEWRVRL